MKYCPNCKNEFKDTNYTYCPFCGTEVKYKREHIPGRLRHQVFLRDNYKCVECGATREETTLEIDHIIPISKGGTNDITNLQTLCKECNRAKYTDTWHGGKLISDNEYDNLYEVEQTGVGNTLRRTSIALGHSTVNDVDLYETRTVRHAGTSTQKWTKLGRGNFTLGGSKSYFVGGGQQRTIETKKIINVTSYNAGIEVSVSNRQKSMRFMLPGRTIEDGQRLADAVLKGEEQVVLTEPKINPKNTELKDSGSCYIATYVYGSYDATEVLTLRKFRDEKLLTNSIGTLFVKFYYKISPFLIKHFGGNIFQKTSKKFLDYIVKKLN